MVVVDTGHVWEVTYVDLLRGRTPTVGHSV